MINNFTNLSICYSYIDFYYTIREYQLHSLPGPRFAIVLSVHIVIHILTAVARSSATPLVIELASLDALILRKSTVNFLVNSSGVATYHIKTFLSTTSCLYPIGTVYSTENNQINVRERISIMDPPFLSGRMSRFQDLLYDFLKVGVRIWIWRREAQGD